MARATDEDILTAAYNLRDARASANAAYTHHLKLVAAARVAAEQHHEAEKAAAVASRELDRLLELREFLYE